MAPSVDGGGTSAASVLGREAKKRAFPVRGVVCVGCSLGSRISPVNRFISQHISSVADDSLWKLAALVYKNEVYQKAKSQGAPAPKWKWASIRSHYELHVSASNIQRHKILRALQLARLQIEQRLVRVDGNEKEVDRASAELLLKIISAESKERLALDNAEKSKK